MPSLSYFDYLVVPTNLLAEVGLRLILITFFLITENMSPFWREIQPEEHWLYKYPHSASYVPTATLYVSTVVSHVFPPMVIISSALVVILVVYFFKRDDVEAGVALCVPTMALPLTGIITNIIKAAVGRPRPDYFDRCYPGVKNFDPTQPCTGDLETVSDGRKSFPSGHSSMSFCMFGFIALYLAAQFGTFVPRGHGRGWRLIIPIVPVMIATLIAISRTCDYHHHWQDVVVGSLIGASVTYLVYRQYFPSLCDYDMDDRRGSSNYVSVGVRTMSGNNNLNLSQNLHNHPNPRSNLTITDGSRIRHQGSGGFTRVA